MELSGSAGYSMSITTESGLVGGFALGIGLGAVVGERAGVSWVEFIALGIVWLWSSRLSLLRYFCRMLQRLLV